MLVEKNQSKFFFYIMLEQNMIFLPFLILMNLQALASGAFIYLVVGLCYLHVVLHSGVKYEHFMS